MRTRSRRAPRPPQAALSRTGPTAPSRASAQHDSTARILCAVAQSGFDHLGVVEPGDTTVHPLTSPFTSLASLRSFGDGAVLVGASATDEPSVVLVDLAPGARSPTFATLRAPRDLGVDRSFLSVPESLTTR